MNDIKNPAAPGSQDNGPRLPCGNVTQDSNAGGTQLHQTRNHSLVGWHLLVHQLRHSKGGIVYARGHVEDGLNSWEEQGVSKQVTFACNVADAGWEFEDRRELELLPSGPGMRGLWSVKAVKPQQSRK